MKKRSRRYFDFKKNVGFNKYLIDSFGTDYRFPVENFGLLVPKGSCTIVSEKTKPFSGEGAAIILGPEHHRGIEMMKTIIDSQEKHLSNMLGISSHRMGSDKLQVPWDSLEDVKRRMDFMFSCTGIAYPGPPPEGPQDFIGMRYIKDIISLNNKKTNDEQNDNKA
jgi:hypothetical protein